MFRSNLDTSVVVILTSPVDKENKALSFQTIPLTLVMILHFIMVVTTSSNSLRINCLLAEKNDDAALMGFYAV
jgi:hypothetical protein